MNRLADRLGPLEVRRRRHRRLAFVALGVLAVAAVLVAVGGDDDPGTAGPPTTVGQIDRDALAAADSLEEVCTVSNGQLTAAYNALLADNVSPTAARDFLGGAFVDLARLRSDALRERVPGADVVAVLDEFDAVVDGVEDDPDAALLANPFEAVNGRWRDAGLGACAIDPTTVLGDV